MTNTALFLLFVIWQLCAPLKIDTPWCYHDTCLFPETVTFYDKLTSHTHTTTQNENKAKDASSLDFHLNFTFEHKHKAQTQNTHQETRTNNIPHSTSQRRGGGLLDLFDLELELELEPQLEQQKASFSFFTRRSFPIN